MHSGHWHSNSISQHISNIWKQQRNISELMLLLVLLEIYVEPHDKNFTCGNGFVIVIFQATCVLFQKFIYLWQTMFDWMLLTKFSKIFLSNHASRCLYFGCSSMRFIEFKLKSVHSTCRINMYGIDILMQLLYSFQLNAKLATFPAQTHTQNKKI